MGQVENGSENDVPIQEVFSQGQARSGMIQHDAHCTMTDI